MSGSGIGYADTLQIVVFRSGVGVVVGCNVGNAGAAVEIFIVGMAVSPVESAVGGKGHRLEIVVDSHGVTLADGRDLGGVLIHGEELAVIAHAVELAVGCARQSDERLESPEWLMCRNFS